MQTLIPRPQTCPSQLRGHLLHRITTLTLTTSALILSIDANNKALGADSASVPNIVLILADDLGWSDIGCYGGEIRTPHIDSLATDGMRFRQFYNNAICGPTRASLLTGLYCQQVGHRGDRWNEPKDFSKCVTIAELLQASGYHTMMVGKWQGRDLAVQRGFDRFFGPQCQAKISYFHEVQNNPFYLNDKRWKFPEGFFMTDAFNNHAVEFLEEAGGGKKPFFLYVGYIAPHWPLHAQEKDIAPYRQMYREAGWDEHRAARFKRQRDSGLVPTNWKLAQQPSSVKPWKNDQHKDWQAERMAVYAAQIAGIDRGVGRILQAIDKAGAKDNTLVMFLSDNGAAPDGGIGPSKSLLGFSADKPNRNWRTDGVAIRPGSGPNNMPGPHDTFAAYGLAWAGVSNTPLRGTKLGAFEGGIRTPLVVRWPQVIRAGGKLDDTVGHVMDFMPTCLEAAGVKYPSEFQGRKPLPIEGKSLVPIFRGQDRDSHRILCWSTIQNQAIRMGNWKLVNARHQQPWQLYDMQADATETTNLASNQPERVRAMSEEFQKWRKRVGAR